jgi:hypothetical protein
MYYKNGLAREEGVTILVISHAACFLLGGFIGLLFAAICAMASDKRSTECQIASDQARLTSLPPVTLNKGKAPAWVTVQRKQWP